MEDFNMTPHTKTNEELIEELATLQHQHNTLKESYLKDIIALENAGELIKESEEKYRILFRDSPDAYLIISEGIFIDCNRATEVMLRGDRTQIIGKSPDILSPQFQPDGKLSSETAEARIKEALAQGRLSFEWEHRRLDGTPLFAEVSVAAMMLDGNQVLFTTWRDVSERRVAEKELIKLRDAIDRSGEAVYMTDKESLFTFVNPGFTATFGYTAEEVVGKATPRILQSHTLSEEQNKINLQTLMDGNEISGESKSRKKDGTILNMEGSVNAFFDENKNIIGLLGIQRDITLKKHAESTFRDIIEKNPMSIQILNMDGLTIQTNPAHTKLFGARPPKDYSIFKDTQLLQQGMGELFDRIKSGEVVYFPDSHFNVHDVDPSFPDVIAWVKTIGFALNDKNGMPERIVLMQENITDRKHVEAMFQDIIDKNPMSIQIVDKEGCTINGNPSYTRLFGALPPPDFSIFDDLSRKSPELEKLILHAKSGEIIHLPDLYYNPRDVSPDFPDIPLWIRALIFPLNDSNGKPERFVFMHENITERKLAEIELIIAKEHAEESDRLKSAFLANMSHEIRTPMNGILGFAELLKTPDLTGDQQKEYLEIIKKSGDRMLNIINDIIDISKIEAGLMKVDIKESNINKQTEYIYNFFKPEVEAKGMQLFLKNTLPAKEAIIKTDREKVFAILTNLVKNAIKYTDQGSIEFGYEKVELENAWWLQFFVKDTGIGIPADRLEAVFERFVQADITDKNAYQGAGLGLSITRAYVEMMGGKIWIETKEGTGSSFYFTLPYDVAEDRSKFAEKDVTVGNADERSGKLKILIAEDDDISKMLVSAIVKEMCSEVLVAISGSKVIEISHDNPDIDLILMDIQMPDLNGYEATRQIRQFNKTVVIIAQTAFAQTGDREKSIAAGCNDYISKPISKDKLLAMIHKYCIHK
jgi:PAS domain S-box-containing protein